MLAVPREAPPRTLPLLSFALLLLCCMTPVPSPNVAAAPWGQSWHTPSSSTPRTCSHCAPTHGPSALGEGVLGWQLAPHHGDAPLTAPQAASQQGRAETAPKSIATSPWAPALALPVPQGLQPTFSTRPSLPRAWIPRGLRLWEEGDDRAQGSGSRSDPYLLPWT